MANNSRVGTNDNPGNTPSVKLGEGSRFSSYLSLFGGIPNARAEWCLIFFQVIHTDVYLNSGAAVVMPTWKLWQFRRRASKCPRNGTPPCCSSIEVRKKTEGGFQ